MNFKTTSEKAAEWNITRRRVTKYCQEGRIKGAQFVGRDWIIPEHSGKPIDTRIFKKLTCIRFIDLFAGLGGMRIGFENGIKKTGLNTECVFTSEIKPHAIKAYKNYFGNKIIYGDITKINADRKIPDFDFLLAGFPCQPFSVAGNMLGFDDTRGTLFFEILRILKSKIEKGRPAAGFLLENVEGLVYHDKGRTLNTIISNLESLGYNVTYKILNSEDFGLPQIRKRIYITGMLDDYISLDSFNITDRTSFKDIAEHGLPAVDSSFTRSLLKRYSLNTLAGKRIRNLPGKNNIHSWDFNAEGNTSHDEKILLNAVIEQTLKKKWDTDDSYITPLTKEQIKSFYNDAALDSMLQKLTKQGYMKIKYIENDTAKTRAYTVPTGKLSYDFLEILDPDKPTHTLVAMTISKIGVIDSGNLRHLTVRECQRLCGYPDSYDLSCLSERQAYDLIGNTICIPVIEAISERIGDKYKQINNLDNLI